MVKSIQVQVQSRKLVKPVTPTPSHLSSYKISVVDELNPSMHVIRILYYPPDATNGKHINLEESLARVLSLFYPLAGRYIKEKHLVDCNDEGAEYSEAHVDCDLLPLIGSAIGSDQLNYLLPLDIGAADEPTDPMMAVQMNKFQCGGLAIGVCASHRIFDSYSLGFFLTAWADAAVGRESKIKPEFDMPSFFPAENLAVPLDFAVSRARDKSIVCKRFMFDKNTISRLRDSASPEWRSTPNIRPPSRVVVTSAVLTQALIRADRAKHGKTRPFLIGQAINVRERTVPPVSKHACGTWVSDAFLACSANESHSLENDYPGLARKLREASIKGVDDCQKILSDKEFARWVLVDGSLEAAEKALNDELKVVWITDWSKFGEYELDFGFGKPVWVSLADVPVHDLFILMNTKESDGIEAWVFLHESDMHYLEQDEDIIKMLIQ